MRSPEQYTCALCDYSGKLIGGFAQDASGFFALCHRDHSNGSTCYEKVTRNASIYRRTYLEQIQLMKERER